MKKKIGTLVATIRMPLYEGDDIDREGWNWFIFEEPAIQDGALVGEKVIGTARRDCETIDAVVELFP